MADGSGVVRARRVEVVDREGRVRIVLGWLGGGEGDGVFGVAVKNDHGRDRVWLVSCAGTAEVGLDHGGNTVAALSVSDDGAPSLFLAD